PEGKRDGCQGVYPRLGDELLAVRPDASGGDQLVQVGNHAGVAPPVGRTAIEASSLRGRFLDQRAEQHAFEAEVVRLRLPVPNSEAVAARGAWLEDAGVT